MNRDSTITLRLPMLLKRRLEARARKMRRSLSSQVVHDLETVMNKVPAEGVRGKFLGLYQGTRVPTDSEFREVRSLLWGSLGRRKQRP